MKSRSYLRPVPYQVKALTDRLKEVQKAITAELKALDRIVEQIEQASPDTKPGLDTTPSRKSKV